MRHPDAWLTENQGYLVAELARLRRLLERHAPAGDDDESDEINELESGPPSADSTTALDNVCRIFSLSSFERGILLLCAGVELDGALCAACANAARGDRATPPSFSLALAVLPDAHWSALTPMAPLRRWRLIEVGEGETLVSSPLRIDERILHYLVGIECLDARLQSVIVPRVPTAPVPPSHTAQQTAIEKAWSATDESNVQPAIHLSGSDASSRAELAAHACASLGYGLHSIAASELPAGARERDKFARLWEREAALTESALLVELDPHEHRDVRRCVGSFVDAVTSPVLVGSDEAGVVPLGQGVARVAAVPVLVSDPTPQEQRLAWTQALGEGAAALNGQIDEVIAQFDLSPDAIRRVSNRVSASGGGGEPHAIWEACREHSRQPLDELAQRIDAVATWDDIVLPRAQVRLLEDVAAHVRQRGRVYQDWGFASKGNRGLGISAMFSGPSGTGKTMAAEVIANELRLDLYRIDLSQVVSKYIGETEKNLARVFSNAESSGAILLFDEADALFGRRSEVKDSHDRYANVEISFLLQRMEAYRGLAILTTNMKSAIDAAFLRRIRFVVDFPFPDVEDRAEIWRRVFPAETPIEGVDRERLAQMNIAGGHIRAIALNAAFLAADADEPVRNEHLLRAAQCEFAKLERSLTRDDVSGWS